MSENEAVSEMAASSEAAMKVSLLGKIIEMSVLHWRKASPVNEWRIM